ncbi:glutathione S-transferase family protein [Hyphomicrobium sp. CS1BSMeth3]|uniref:glutathione S-transferase family protein n=1 Tax=Hyphomicrobium sp. CS1BSMeth3 TaxID=1892844 RepID=UPI0009304712|nr:glutathione S-transferase family protein [Hyphomicrobium sp. CS1BSMeth3]
MKLIGRYDSPYVRRVGVTLHVLEQPFEHVPLSPFSQVIEFRKHAAIGRMPVLILDSGETLIESAAILDHLDEIAGPSAALIPSGGPERRRSLKILACATAACDKAIAINYERRRPVERILDDWIERCRTQLDAAFAELESFHLELRGHRRLQQIEITTACAYAYVRRVEPDAVQAKRYPWLERLSSACELRQQFLACPQ